ncbi:MAG TPA: GTP-binding protein [Pirellulaceae bacterium]|nr:GTP-binding protein [Pirellulaceae bacterium]
MNKAFSGLLMLLVAAVAGLALLLLPNWLVTQYQTVSALGSFWGWLYLIVVTTGLFLLAGSTILLLWRLWGRKLAKKLRRERRNRNPSELSLGQQSAEIDENLDLVGQLRSGQDDLELRQQLDPLVREFEIKRESQTLEIVAFGTISSGKSSVLNLLAGRNVFATELRGGTTVSRNEIPWPKMDKVVLVDTPGLGEIDGAEHVNIAAQSAKNADLILLIVDGPLRNSEFALIKELGQMEKRIIICLNKSDWYEREDRLKLTSQIASQVREFVESNDIVAIQAETGFRLRKVVSADGAELEERIPVPSDISSLAERMTSVVRSDGKELLMANLLLQSRGLVENARMQAKDLLDQRAYRIVDKYAWGAGGVAAILPGPFIDLVAGVGISTKMIVDIAEVYQQPVDLDTARKWIGEMGKNLISVLGVHAAMPAVTSVVASMIKTVPVAGTIAGGIVQGCVQALITKWIGVVFVDYFRNEMKTPEGGLAGLARKRWEELTTIAELRKLVTTARQNMKNVEND